jgi:hypothetical protein
MAGANCREGVDCLLLSVSQWRLLFEDSSLEDKGRERVRRSEGKGHLITLGSLVKYCSMDFNQSRMVECKYASTYQI